MQVCHYTNPAGEFRVGCEYNEASIAVWRSMGGRFDGVNKEWVFPGSSADRVSKEVERLFGLSDENPVTVRVRAGDMGSGDGAFRGWSDGPQVTLGGYVLATRRQRDQRATQVVPLVEGLIPMSGGSAKRPAVNPSPDAIFEIEVRRDFADANGLDYEEAPTAAAGSTPRGAVAEERTFSRGPHLLRVDVPGGPETQTVLAVRSFIEAMDDTELLKRLRPII